MIVNECKLDSRQLTSELTTTFRDQRILLGAKCKSGSEAKEVEFLRRLHSVCLTFLMRPTYIFLRTITGNICWKKSAGLVPIQQVIIISASAPASEGHRGAVTVTVYT